MPEKRFFNKYPYTDFHELNLDWVVEKTEECVEAVDEMDDRVTTLESSMTNVQGRLTTAEERIARQEQDIHGLSTTIGNIGTRVTALENADIQDADMLDGVSSVEAGSSSVTVNFSAAAYTDGVKTAGTDAAVIPAASTTAAGVMVPGDKAKLNAFNVDASGNVTFLHAVSGSGDPVSNAEFTTKEYVDSLAISGSAEVSEDSVAFTSSTATLSPYVTSKIRRYGKVRELDIHVVMDEATSNIAVGTSVTAKIATGTLLSTDLPSMNKTVWVTGPFGDTIYSPVAQIRINASSGQIEIFNRATAISAGNDDGMSIDAHLTYIVN